MSKHDGPFTFEEEDEPQKPPTICDNQIEMAALKFSAERTLSVLRGEKLNRPTVEAFIAGAEWAIKHDPLKPDIFEMTYEPA
jgi:hypothetical protein